MENLDSEKNLNEQIIPENEIIEVTPNPDTTEDISEKIFTLNNNIKKQEDIIDSTIKAVEEIRKSLGIEGQKADIPSIEFNKNKKSKFEFILSKISSTYNLAKTATLGAGIIVGANIFEAQNIDQNTYNKINPETEKNINIEDEKNKAINDRDISKAEDESLFTNWEKIKATVNPENWGILDYTDSGDFSLAYTKAKTKGEKEFMWNNNRYNTDYAGTPRQEIGKYGINGVLPEDINNPYQVNQYDKLSPDYLTGHIEGGFVNPNKVNLEQGVANKTVKGYYTKAPQESPERGSSTYIYGIDKSKILENVSKEKENDHPYNLLDNNCADRVERVLEIDTNKTRILGVANPPLLLNEIKKTYPSIDVTGRTVSDYMYQIKSSRIDEVMNNAEYFLGITNSPELIKLKENVVRKIQVGLSRAGYRLPKSTLTESGSYDGVFGEETRQALLDWQTKNKK